MKKTDKKRQIPFGLHLMLEAYDCSPDVLSNKDAVYKILDELPGLIGMRKLTEPSVIKAEGNNKRDPGGWSGFVIIQESHIAIHTFIKRGFVTADVYSCKDFDTSLAIKYFKQFFQTEDIEYGVEQRGIKYPVENIDE